MRIRKKNILVIALAIFFFLIAYYFERNAKQYSIDADDIGYFQNRLNEKETKLLKLFDSFEKQLRERSIHQIFSINSLNFKDLYRNEGLAVLIYEHDSLIFWTDNLLPVPNLYNEFEVEGKIVHLKNAWYIFKECEVEGYKVVGLVLIKRDYSYENEFLVNEFQREFKIPNDINVVIDRTNSNFDIFDNEGNYLISLVYSGEILYNFWYINLSGIFYLLGILFFLIFCKRIFEEFLRNKLFYITVMISCLVLIRFIMLKFSIPVVFNHMDIFNPQLFAGSKWFPSLGDFFINSIFIFFAIYVLFSEFGIFLFDVKQKSKKYAISFGLFIILAFFFVFINSLLQSLIFNSSILFEAYKIFDLTIYSFFGFFIFALLITSYLLLAGKIVTEISSFLKFKNFTLVFIGSLFIVIFLLKAMDARIEYGSILFVIFSVFFLAFVRYKQGAFKYSFIVFLALLSAIYTTGYIYVYSSQKEREIRKVLVEKLSNERDQIAEMLFEEVSQEIYNDTLMKRLAKNPFENEPAINNNLVQKYFSGYFSKYEIHVNACGIDFDLLIEDTKELVLCHYFFEEMISEMGVFIPGTKFYFLDNVNGSVSYLGVINFYEDDAFFEETTLYISLDSKLAIQGLGYPELLLDKRAAKYTSLKNYSYVKYFEDELITHSGDFNYPLINSNNLKEKGDFVFLTFDDYNHLFYKADDQNTIAISQHKISLLDGLISFSYLFVFYYFLLSLVFFILNYPENIKSSNYTFKTRIKLSMVSVLLLSLLFIGTGTIYYSVKQYEKKQYENIKEKTQSVLVELQHKLGAEAILGQDIEEYLETLLVKFSNVFFSDINLYSIQGTLLASSRPEVFEKGLIGNKMNPEAYLQLIVNKKTDFIHKERMGKLKYYSSYVPFYNANNQLLAYLNLPYFTKQSNIKNEIYTLAIAIINIYALLLIITTIIAVFISNKLTSPLQLIQNKLREIGLQKKNEQINYSGQDEIGSLIKEYNRMVAELSSSADLLAKSERETAWREVSKQVAHEIKNPLTPMKLTVQHLKQTYKSDNPDEIKKADKFFNIIIEQIDNLSAIATEFSNFAKMPKAKLEKVSIVEKIRNTIRLFANQNDVDFHLQVNCDEKIYVYADKEQLQRVFLNLIKNAIQAVSSERRAIIRISLSSDNKNVQVKLEDNGNGIPEDMRTKLFSPNFTTKSGGMGLGLSIVKNIIEHMKGEIWFETEVDKGSIFFVEIPIYNE